MKERITITIDVSKIDKAKIFEKKYMKDGKEVMQKLYKIEVIPLKNEAFITEGDTWRLIKTHFATEYIKGEKGNILGDGVVIRNKDHGVDMASEHIPS